MALVEEKHQNHTEELEFQPMMLTQVVCDHRLIVTIFYEIHSIIGIIIIIIIITMNIFIVINTLFGFGVYFKKSF